MNVFLRKDLEIDLTALFAMKLFIDVGVWLNCFGIVYMSRIILCHIEPTKNMLMLFLRDVLMLPDDFVFRFDTKACSHSSPKVCSLLFPYSCSFSLSSRFCLPFSLFAAIKQNKVLT